MSPGKRSLVHADGRAAILAGDTAWGLPWRATHAECEIYAADRQAKGFNAVLLMITDKILDDFELSGFGTALLASLLISLANIGIAAAI